MAQTTVISAPGKVLIAGGYLVLDQLYSGLVLATSSRFYTVIRDASASTPTTSSSSETETPTITARAGQFPKDGSIWTFAVRIGTSDAGGEGGGGGGGGGGEVKLEAVGDAKNKFVQITLECGLRYVQARLRQDLGDQEGDKELLRRLRRQEGGGLDVVVLADNDFYSQRETLTSMGLEPRISSLAQLPPFSPLPRPIQSTNKTGLGSSAALVTSLTAGLLSHLGIVTLEPTSSSELHTAPNNGQTTSDSDIIHSLAQYAHCLAQGKVGSGFDVSSAVYGSHIYRRFSPSLLTPLMDRLTSEAGSASASTSTSTSTRNAQSLLHHLDPSRWDSQARPFRLPKGLRLVLADVDAGTDTPSFVGKVLEWRKRESAEALRLWTGLDESNRRLEGVLAELCGMEGSGGLEEAADKAMAELDGSQAVYRTLQDARSALEVIRALMREMSEASGVPIEPPKQTRLLDKCCACPGVIGGGVPGAGGYDAIFLLIIDEPSVLQHVEKIWSSWTEMSVCPLSARQSDGGLRREKLDGVTGLDNALARLT